MSQTRASKTRIPLPRQPSANSKQRRALSDLSFTNDTDGTTITLDGIFEFH